MKIPPIPVVEQTIKADTPPCPMPEPIPAGEPSPDIETADNPPSDELERMLAEAEERGYKRGRNESIARLMEHPEQVDPELTGTPSGSDPEILILANIRPSIWS